MTFKIIFTLSCIFSSLNLVAAGQHTDGTGGNISAPIFSEAPGRLKLEYMNRQNQLQEIELEFHKPDFFGDKSSMLKKLNQATTKRQIRKIGEVCETYGSTIKANTEAIFFFGDSYFNLHFISHSPTDTSKLDFNIVSNFDDEDKIVCSRKLGEMDREVFLATVTNYFQKVAQRYLFTFAETEFLYETGASQYSDLSKVVNEIMALSYVEKYGKNLASQLLKDVNIRNSAKRYFYYKTSYHSNKDFKAIIPAAYEDIDEALRLFFKQDYDKSIVDFLEGFYEFLLMALDIANFGFEKTQRIDTYKAQVALEFPFYEKSIQYSEQIFRVAPGSSQWQSLRERFLLEFSESSLKPAFCRWDKNGILRIKPESNSIESPAKILEKIFSHFSIIFGQLNIDNLDLECMND